MKAEDLGVWDWELEGAVGAWIIDEKGLKEIDRVWPRGNIGSDSQLYKIGNEAKITAQSVAQSTIGGKIGGETEPIDMNDTGAVLKSLGATSFTKNKDGRYDVTGNITVYQMEKMPVKFGAVIGDFDCSHNNINSLEDAPTSVTGDFKCSGLMIKNLIGAPENIGGDFIFSFNSEIVSLEGMPKHIGGSIDMVACSKITKLEHIPEKVNGNFECGGVSERHSSLSSLEGSPKHVTGHFRVSNSDITSYKGAPDYVGKEFQAMYNKLNNNLKGVPAKAGKI